MKKLKSYTVTIDQRWSPDDFHGIKAKNALEAKKKAFAKYKKSLAFKDFNFYTEKETI